MKHVRTQINLILIISIPTYVGNRPGVMVICNSNDYNCSIIVIDGTECNVIVMVIVIESKVIVIELLLCYYN